MENGIVVTGAGIASAYGLGNGVFVREYNAGRSGIRDLTLFRNPFYARKSAAEVPDFDPSAELGKKGNRNYDRVTLLLLTALEILYREAGFTREEAAAYRAEETGIIVGTSGPLRSIFEFDLAAVRDPQYVSPGLFPNTVFCAPASYAAIRKGIKGGCITITNGETSSLNAAGMAMDSLRLGRSSMVVFGGAEELTEIYASCVQKVARASGERDPLLGEGAVLFVMENEKAARKRGAPLLARILGHASVFCSDAARGYSENLSRLRRNCPEKEFVGLRHIFSGQRKDLAKAGAGAEPVRIHQLYRRFGYLGALGGAMALAAALADRSIAPGDNVLINGFGQGGNCSSLLVKKLEHLV